MFTIICSELIRRILIPFNIRDTFRPIQTLRNILVHVKDPTPPHSGVHPIDSEGVKVSDGYCSVHPLCVIQGWYISGQKQPYMGQLPRVYCQFIITQYSSTVYIGVAMGWSSIITIHKEIFSFHFQFQTSNDIKVENLSKSNCMQKFYENITQVTKYR